jgi:NAD(P)-dependent dehydrogenase (short-subunit alcohol dehydrogenase family)
MELAPFGVRVMEVQPGAIASSFAKNAGHEAEQLISEQSPWFPLREGIRARARASRTIRHPPANLPPECSRLCSKASRHDCYAWAMAAGRCR